MPKLMFNSGHVCLYDDDSADVLSKYKWYYHKVKSKEYVRGRKILGGGKMVYMHRLLQPGAKEVDHINGNGLDNRVCNLRACTREQNNWNRKDDGTKGVYFESSTQRYVAEIRYKKKKIKIGRYKEFKKAKMEYNRKAKELFGSFCNVVEPC